MNPSYNIWRGIGRPKIEAVYAYLVKWKMIAAIPNPMLVNYTGN